MKNKEILNSIIPLGMIFGTSVGILLSLFFESISMLLSIASGSGIGLLIGVVIFGLYSGKA